MVISFSLSGYGNHTVEMRESQRESPIGILLIDVLLCSSLTVIRSTNVLNNRTILIHHLPNLLLHDTRKAVDEVVSVNRLFHFLFLFFLSLYYTYRILACQYLRKIFFSRLRNRSQRSPFRQSG